MTQKIIPEKIYKWVKRALLIFSILLWAATSSCYGFRPDACTAVTFWPSWVWLLMGILLAILGGRCLGKWVFTGIILMWLLYMFVFVEETRSLIRFRFSSELRQGAIKQKEKTWRVISLNCAGGKLEAAREVKLYGPDIVLLQESPPPKEVAVLADELFSNEAGVAWCNGTSIVAKGHIQPVSLPRSQSRLMTQARVHLTSGIEIEVISVHLMPPPVRLDLFSPACWKEHAEIRRYHREQVKQIMEQIHLIPETLPLIVGGDFNAPANDGALHILKPRLHDSFREAGIGWGNTALNDTPLLRIDQVWVSEHFRAAAVFSRKTNHSDHRMVICDLLVKSIE